MKNLILAPSNIDSHVRNWSKDLDKRNFDIILTYYENDGREQELEKYADEIHVMRGFKYPSAHKVISDNPKILEYDYVWMPDDDIFLETEDINRLFDIVNKYDIWLGMPSIRFASDSFKTFSAQIHQAGNILRYVGFIEVQCPIFSKYALNKCWQTFNESQSGWGLDMVWGKLLGKPINKLAVIDEVVAKHTRPVGRGELYEKLNIDPKVEMRALMKKYNADMDRNVYGKIEKK